MKQGRLSVSVMPLYDYRCHRCGRTFEVRQKFSDEALTVHEECGGELERLISAPALQFKGSGWYVTDYKNNGGATASNGGSGSAESKSESKTESKSETKSESKSDSKPAPAASSTDK